MLKNLIRFTATAALFAGSLVTLNTTQASAQSAYQLSNTQTVTPKPYHLTSYKATIYSWDKTHTKRMALLSDEGMRYMTWYVTQTATMTYKGKSTTYFRLADNYGRDYGYASAKSLVKGFDPKDDENLPYKPSTKTTSTANIHRVSEKVFAKDVPSLTKNTYYRTTQKVSLPTDFTTYLSSGTFKVTTSLPKGTVVAGDRYSTQLSITTSELSRNLLAPGYQQNLWASTSSATTSAAKINAFQKTKRPAYLPKNGSNGDLYLGGVTALKNKYNGLAKQTVQITTNGYVEVRKNNPSGESTEYQAKPSVSDKIKRTTIKGHTRYLYLANPLKGFKTTKVTYRGTTQYRLAFTNQLKTYAEITYSDDEPTSPSYYGLMSFGGKTFYTPYGIIPDDN